MLIIVGLQEETTGIAIVLSCSGEPIEVIVESFPLSIGVSNVLEVSIMQFSCLIQVSLNLNKVISDHAFKFAPIDQYQELGFYSCIKVHLYHGCLVTVNPDVLELLVLLREVVVILVEGGDHGVPLGCEVEQGE